MIQYQIKKERKLSVPERGCAPCPSERPEMRNRWRKCRASASRLRILENGKHNIDLSTDNTCTIMLDRHEVSKRLEETPRHEGIADIRGEWSGSEIPVDIQEVPARGSLRELWRASRSLWNMRIGRFEVSNMSMRVGRFEVSLVVCDEFQLLWKIML